MSETYFFPAYKLQERGQISKQKNYYILWGKSEKRSGKRFIKLNQRIDFEKIPTLDRETFSIFVDIPWGSERRNYPNIFSI